jgi:hypothetical protein
LHRQREKEEPQPPCLLQRSLQDPISLKISVPISMLILVALFRTCRFGKERCGGDTVCRCRLS